MKFLLVDDHVLIREALRGVVRELDADAAVLEAARWGEASRLLKEHPDVTLVLLDPGLPDREGLAALAEARMRHPKVPVVILSANSDCNEVERALGLGAVGFIPKSGERDVMLSALRLVLSGGVYIPPQILTRSEAPALTVRRNAVPSPILPADLGLTARQVDVLSLMRHGMTNKAICRELKLAEATVKNHVTAILKALNVTNRTAAVVRVGELGWELPRPKE
jgi:DNA-binding NarL/FixJ family response regulator